MTSPAEQNAPAPAAPSGGPDTSFENAPTPTHQPAPAPAPTADPLATLGIDLGSLLGGPGATDVNIVSVDGGISGFGGVQTNVGVDASISAGPTGIPEVSAGVEGQFVTEGQFDTFGSYENIDASTNTVEGTTDVSIQQVDGGISGEGGLGFGGSFGFDFKPTTGVIPELGVEADANYGTYGGIDTHGGFDDIQVHSDTTPDGGFF